MFMSYPCLPGRLFAPGRRFRAAYLFLHIVLILFVWKTSSHLPLVLCGGSLFRLLINLPFPVRLIDKPLNDVGIFFSLVRGLYLNMADPSSASRRNSWVPNMSEASTWSDTSPSSSPLLFLRSTKGSVCALLILSRSK